MLPLTNACVPNSGLNGQMQPSQYYQIAETYANLVRLQQQTLNAYSDLKCSSLLDFQACPGMQPWMLTTVTGGKYCPVAPKPLPLKPHVGDVTKCAALGLSCVNVTPVSLNSTSAGSPPLKQRVKVATPRRYAYKKIWTDAECILLLLCTRMLIYRELKTITRAFYQCIERKPGVCWGRAAEKKLKRMITFKNWKTCNKNKVLEEIDVQLKSFGASTKVSRDSKLFKVVHRIITKKSEPKFEESEEV